MTEFQPVDFHPGARVESKDGMHVGSLHRLVIDRQSWDLKEIIVKETEWFSGRVLSPGSGLLVEDVIVPLEALASVTHNHIRLSATAAEVRADGWWEHDVVLQVRFLERSDDLALFAHLTDRDVERLQPFLTGESDK